VLTDLRQVTYNLADNGQGLQRQETILVMAQDLSGNNTVSPTTEDPSQSVPPQMLAEEVDSLEFQYYDAQAGWVQNWPQDATNYDGVTPIGPPMAVKITLHMKSTHAGMADEEDANQGHTYTQVVAIPTANAAMIQTPPVMAGSSGANQPLTQQP
jgi:hypothetical protein